MLHRFRDQAAAIAGVAHTAVVAAPVSEHLRESWNENQNNWSTKNTQLHRSNVIFGTPHLLAPENEFPGSRSQGRGLADRQFWSAVLQFCLDCIPPTSLSVAAAFVVCRSYRDFLCLFTTQSSVFARFSCNRRHATASEFNLRGRGHSNPQRFTCVGANGARLCRTAHRARGRRRVVGVA